MTMTKDEAIQEMANIIVELDALRKRASEVLTAMSEKPTEEKEKLFAEYTKSVENNLQAVVNAFERRKKEE